MPGKRLLCLLIILLLNTAGTSAISRAQGARPAGLSGAVTALYGFCGINNNQAGISLIEHPLLAIYTENRYMVEGMSMITAAFVHPATEGVLGISLNFHGNRLYSESILGVAYARKFGERLSAGVRLNYFHIRTGLPAAAKGCVAAEAGIIYELLPGFFTGVHIFNPSRAILSEQPQPLADERITTVIRKGVSYVFSPGLILSLEAEKDINHPLSLKLGLEYKPGKNLTARAGIGSNPMQNSIGMGYSWGNWQFDIASSYHFILGHSPQAGIKYLIR